MNKRKGIILAGGRGTRLYPLTHVTSKQLLPVYDKPMIYYPLSVLMLADIREILIITTPADLDNYYNLLGDGSQWGLDFSYAVQKQPEGLAQALIIGDEFANNSNLALILGDNIFYAHHLQDMLKQANDNTEGATLFVYPVDNPEAYGVIEFDKEGNPINLVEKPKHFVSKYAVTGLYFYDNQAIDFAKNLQPSPRGELEITDLNRLYLQQNQVKVIHIGRGSAWLDGGTHDSLLQASQFIETLEKRQGLKIACPEEIAYRRNFINAEQLEKLALLLNGNTYGAYLLKILQEKEFYKNELSA